MGAVTTAFCATQASATWARATPRPSAMAPTASIMAWSDSRACVYSVLPNSSLSWRAVGRHPLAGQAAARQRAPGDHPHALVSAQRQHLALFLAVEQVVVVLHGDEARPAVALGDVLGLGELPGMHRRGPDVARLAALHDIVEGLHGLFDGRRVVPAVDLIQVDVVHAEAAQAIVNAGEDGLAREAAAVRRLAPGVIDLGGHHDLVAASQLLERAAGELLAGAVGVAVGRVEEVDAQLNGLAEEGPAVGLRQGPGMHAARRLAIGHAAQGEARHSESGIAQSAVFHSSPSAPAGASLRPNIFHHDKPGRGRLR